MVITLTEMQKSALQETGNIGSGHAAIALSQLMGKRIMIVIPTVEVFLLKDLKNILGGEAVRYVLVSLSVLGQVQGSIIFVLEEKMAFKLCNVVMALDLNKEQPKTLGELELSALKEIGSILAAAYLNAVSELTDIPLLVSVPTCNIGGISLINTIITAKNIAAKDTDCALCVKTEFVESATRIDGYIIFMPAENAIEKIIASLGV